MNATWTERYVEREQDADIDPDASISDLAKAAGDAQAALNRAVWHDDKKDERVMHVSTGPGDLTTYGSPILRRGI